MHRKNKTQNNLSELRQTLQKPRLVAFYNIQPGNGRGLFLQAWSLARAAGL